jgi:hypothetical protein
MQVSYWFVNARKRLWKPYIKNKEDEDADVDAVQVRLRATACATSRSFLLHHCVLAAVVRSHKIIYAA